MSKVNRTDRNKKQVQQTSSFDFDKFIPYKYHALFGLLSILTLFLIYLYPLYFGNKTFQAGDIFSSQSFVPYVTKEREGFSLWNPLIFLGMPAYAIGTSQTWFNIIYMIVGYIRQIFTGLFSVEYTTWTFYLIILGFSSYLLMYHLTKKTLVSLFTGIATSFSTGIIVYLYIGHVTKLVSLSMFPFVLLLLLKMQSKFKWLYFILLIIIVQLMIQGFHLQIIFYELLGIGIYFLFYIIHAIVKKEVDLRNKLVRSGLALIGAIILGFLISADNFSQIYEYSDYSTRGGKSIVETTASKENVNSGDYYEYHTDWSFSPGELMTFIIPSYYGFGSSTYEGPLSPDPVEVNTYFGQMRFVDVAMYMGIIVLFLAIYSIIALWKNPFVKYLTIFSVIALLLSFGRNWPILFNLLFNYLPLFNKFRVPSMILVVPQICLPILAGLGLNNIIEILRDKNNNKEKEVKIVKYFTYAISSMFLLSILLSGSLRSSFIERISAFSANNPNAANMFNALSEYMADMFINDLLIGFGILTATFWLFTLYLNQKINKEIVLAAIIIFTLIDLWRIDARGQKYIDNPQIKASFETPRFVEAIRSVKDDSPFRILNLDQKSQGYYGASSNFNAYFLLEDFGGYSGIKPRSYQDIIDVLQTPVNPTLWRMLNIRYIMTSQGQILPNATLIDSLSGSWVFRNNDELGRCYFVNSVEKRSGIDILNSIKNNGFDPKNVAFLDENINVDKIDSLNSISYTKYTDENVFLNVKASGNNFLFFGTTYLPTGWKAYVDEKETKIFKANHGFMGIIVPKGNHEVKFIYLPDSFVISKYLSLIISSLTVLGLLATILVSSRKKLKTSND